MSDNPGAATSFPSAVGGQEQYQTATSGMNTRAGKADPSAEGVKSASGALGDATQDLTVEEGVLLSPSQL